MKHEIYTEYKEGIEEIVNQYFRGYNLTSCTGYWEGAKEKSAIITICTPDTKRVKELCDEIRLKNEQEAVLLVIHETKEFYIR